VDPGAWGVAPPPRLHVDFVVNSALLIKTLQVRQQGRTRVLHRFWCWPQRSSHGRDQLGYRPCTLTRGPAPKSTTTLILYRSILPLILSPEIARRSSQKKLVLTFLGVGRWTPRPFTKRARRVVRLHRSRLSGERGCLARCVTRLAGRTSGAFRRGARAPPTLVTDRQSRFATVSVLPMATREAS
jgi:hypothetical protein